MSGDIEDPKNCEAFTDDLAELALGILSGRIRSEVLNHVESCLRCSSELERLSIVADTLLQLAPEIEPPLGFELRLATRLNATATLRRPKRSRRMTLLAVAAVIAVVFGIGFGGFLIPRSGSNDLSATANLTSANLTSDGQVLGEVLVSQGSPAWMFMTIDAGSWSGEVRCELTLSGGYVETIGVFKLSSGYGAWGAPLTSTRGQVQSARLIAPNGSIVASAQLLV
jgi:hypothetical protein